MIDEGLVLRDGVRVAGLWIRVCLLVVLLWGALVTVLAASPAERSAADFHAALEAGRVTYVIQEKDALRWSAGPLFWYRTETAPPDVTGVPVVRRHSREDYGIVPAWPFRVPVAHAEWVTGTAWVATLFVMLGTPRPRVGNRWAWFWLFTVGRIGAVLFLLFEPRAIWNGIGPQSNSLVGRFGGGQGCVTAFCVQVMISVLAVMGIADTVRALLDVLLTGP